MKYYIIAGESSGDLYGARLISEIKKLDSQADFKFWGGPQMKDVAPGQLKSIRETAFMGFYEVAKNIFRIRDLFKFAKYTIEEFQPDVVILIDYPGFNLRLSHWLKEKAIRTVFYISPQLWAWKEGRHKILRDNIDQFFVILPFEKEFYRNLDTPCIYHGHPLKEIIGSPKPLSKTIKKIGLFPGSREQEIERILPEMIEFAQAYPQYQFVISSVQHIHKSTYTNLIPKGSPNIELSTVHSYPLMQQIDFAIACSGTTTLELALHNIPQIVVYKTSQISFAIGKRLVNTKYIALVNLIVNREIVPELLQGACNSLAIQECFEHLNNEGALSKMISEYAIIRDSLGEGRTSALIAGDIVGGLGTLSRD